MHGVTLPSKVAMQRMQHAGDASFQIVMPIRPRIAVVPAFKKERVQAATKVWNEKEKELPVSGD